MKSLRKIHGKISEKIIIIRLDLNVPILNGKIQDTHRIDKIIHTLNYLISQNSKVVIISHVGRPNGKIINHLSLKPISHYLSKMLNCEVVFVDEKIKNLKKDSFVKKKGSEVFILENIRFYPEEELNDLEFAKKIASFGDIFVNEAFSCSHRKHATVTNVTKFVDSYAGFLMESEVTALDKLIKKVNEPLTCIIGGSKISTKIKVILNLIPKINNLIIVGGMANNFLKFKENEIGNSLYEKNFNSVISQIYSLAQKNSCNVLIPEDVKVGKHINDTSTSKFVKDISSDDQILDIGERTILKIKSIIDKSKTVLWNGPAGYFENLNFSEGSYEIANFISDKTLKGNLYSVIGGGDTVAVINKKKLFKNFSFVSTAGGAFLEYLEGKQLPGIKSLEND